MTVNIYDLGDKPRLTATFAVDGVNTDPTAAALIIKQPDATYKSYLISTGFSLQGNWDAATNTPTLANGTGTIGHYYAVTVAGSVNFGNGSQAFAVGDYVAYDGDSWLLIPSPQSAVLTKDSTGVYYYDFPVHQDGIYDYRSEGFGIVHAADEGRFRVTKSKIR